MLSSAKEFWKGFFVQLHVINALILRETRTRFGKHSLGYLWAFVEPLAWIGTFLAIFYLGRRTPPDGMEAISFLATGLLPYIMFRSTMSRSMSAIKANKPLLYYPQVRPLDLVAARALLEATTFLFIFVIIILATAIFVSAPEVDSLLKVLGGFTLVALLGASMGLAISSLTAMFQTLENLINPLMRPLLWISGVFFTAKELPLSIREKLLWNPLLQITELTRSGFFSSYTGEYYNLSYLSGWILTAGFVGLMLERITRRKIEG